MKHRRQQFREKTAVAMRSAENREHKRFYDSALWQKVRKRVLMETPYCQQCASEGRMALAEMVDHVTPLRLGGARVARDNLAALCHPCHNRKRQREAMEVKCSG